MDTEPTRFNFLPKEKQSICASRIALRALPNFWFASKGPGFEQLALNLLRATISHIVTQEYNSKESTKLTYTLPYMGLDQSLLVHHPMTLDLNSRTEWHVEPSAGARADGAWNAVALLPEFPSKNSFDTHDIEMLLGYEQSAFNFYGISSASCTDIAPEGNATIFEDTPHWNMPLFQGIEDDTGVQSARGQFMYATNSPTWSFWRKWYLGFAYGNPLDWELQQRIALIEEAVWDAGPEAVATEIAAIEAQFLSRKIPLMEVVEFNDSSGKFSVVPREIAKPDLLGATLSQVEDALDDVLANPTNGLNERAREIRVLRRALLKYSSDPQRVEMDFTSVHAGLTRQIVVEDLPPTEANLALQRALEEGAQAVRATHSDVAENRRILDTQKIAELTKDQNAKLAKAQPLLESISSGVMQENFNEDITYLLEERFRVLMPQLGAADRNPVLAGYDEKRRTFGRLARIAIWLIKSPQVLDRIDGSAGYKAATILLTIKELINFGIGLF